MLLLLLAFSSFCSTAPTDEIPAEAVRHLTLQECIDEALGGNLSLRASQYSVERSRAMEGTAYDFEKTEIALGQDPTSGGSPDNAISVSQSLDFPTVYVQKHRALKAETVLEESRKGLTEQEVKRSVAEAYYKLAFLQQKMSLLQRQDSLYGEFFNLASAKVRHGESSRLEEMNAKRLQKENRLAMQQVKLESTLTEQTLQTLLHTSDTILPTEDCPLAVATDISEGNLTAHPAYQVQASSIALQERNVVLAKQNFLPNINISLRSQTVISGFNPYNIERSRFEKGNFMGFEVGIGIPLFFSGHKARLKAAQADLQLAQAQQEEAYQALFAEQQQARSEWTEARQRLKYYEEEGLPEADEMARISQKSYEAGEIGYIEYIQNLAAACDVQLQYIEACETYNQSVVRLNFLTIK